MQESELIKSYLNGTDFSTSHSFTKENMSMDSGGGRIEEIVKIISNKKVVHLGCCDHLPVIEPKRESHTWLHDIVIENTDETIGFDISKEAVEYVSQHLGIDNVFCLDISHDIEDTITILKENGSAYDYILAGEIVEHLDNPVMFLKSIKDNYNGFIRNIILSVPNGFCLSNFKNSFHNIEKINTDHRYWFTPFTISKILCKAGITTEKIVMCDYVSTTERLLKKMGRIMYGNTILVIGRL